MEKQYFQIYVKLCSFEIMLRLRPGMIKFKFNCITLGQLTIALPYVLHEIMVRVKQVPILRWKMKFTQI